MSSSVFSSIPEALEDIRQGKCVIVMDDENRENEGDLIGAAQYATPEMIAFIRKHSTGYLCAPMTAGRAAELNLPLMVADSSDPNKTAYTWTVDSIENSTGVSGYDRATTFRHLADPTKKAEAFRRPGHTCPLIAKPGGVLERQGHTEASVDLCRLAGVEPVGIICELVVKDDDTCPMMRLPECISFAQKYKLKLITIEQLIKYRLETEPGSKLHEGPAVRHGVELDSECKLPVELDGENLGEFDLKCWYSLIDGKHHVTMSRGDLTGPEPVLTRVHSECFTGDILGSLRCDCREQLHRSLKLVAETGRGLVVYNVGHEGRGIGLANKIKAYALQQQKGLDTYEANRALGFEDDLRKYDTAKAIISSLGIAKIRLMTSNTTKVSAFAELVDSVQPLEGTDNPHNHGYLSAKRLKIGVGSTSGLSVQEGRESIKSSPIILPSPNRPDLKVGIVHTSWNQKLVEPFALKVKSLLRDKVKDIELVKVPGCLETPLAAQRLIKKGYDVVICIGLLLKGETTHFEEVSAATFKGLMDVQISTGIPVISGIYTCLTEEQAHARLGSDSTLAESLAASALTVAL
mgnify:CR=1 FL=1